MKGAGDANPARTHRPMPIAKPQGPTGIKFVPLNDPWASSPNEDRNSLKNRKAVTGFNTAGLIRRSGSFRLPRIDKTPEATTSRPTVRTALLSAMRWLTTQSGVSALQTITPKGYTSMLTPEALIDHHGRKNDVKVTKLMMIPR